MSIDKAFIYFNTQNVVYDPLHHHFTKITSKKIQILNIITISIT